MAENTSTREADMETMTSRRQSREEGASSRRIEDRRVVVDERRVILPQVVGAGAGSDSTRRRSPGT